MRIQAPPVVTRSTRFWLLYLAMWVPYGVVYLLVFLMEVRAGFAPAVSAALINVVPAALLGVGVVELSMRLHWPERHRVRAVAVHAMLAGLYSWLWFAALVAAFTIKRGLARGDWTLVMFAGPARTWQLLQGVLLYLVVAGVGYGIRAAAELREKEARITRADALRARAELQALRARLNPHFLFNTLHSVSALVRQDGGAAEQALEQFAGMMRYVLNAQSDTADDVPLESEWAFVRDYLALEQLRLGPRLRLVTDIDPDTLDCAIPVFTVQPLVENAVRHAIAPRAQGGTLSIRSWFCGEDLCLEVRDDGPGAAPDSVQRASGIGLRVVQQRLKVRYGGRASLQVDTAPGQGFRCALRIPLHPSAAAPAEAEWKYARSS